ESAWPVPTTSAALPNRFLMCPCYTSSLNKTDDGEYRVRFSAAVVERFLPQRLALRARPFLNRIDAALFAADERGEAGRMSVIAFAIRIFSAVIAFAS